MKDNKERETELRLKINHDYFIRRVIVEACMQVILLLITGFIFTMCIISNTEGGLIGGVMTLVAYVIFSLIRIHKIVTLHGEITDYENSVVKDTIHSAIK